MAEESLKNKTVKGVAWSGIDSIASRGISFLVSLVLARLLTPGEYGLIGIVAIFIAVFNILVESGFSHALIWKVDSDDLDYNTVFFANLVLSILLSLGLFLLAPGISDFFNQPVLTELTRAMSVVIIISALAIIQRTILNKNLNFKVQTKISLISSVVSGVVGIGCAFGGLGVWALVWQQISFYILNSGLLWKWGKWRPKLQYSWSRFNYLFGFGWKILASNLIDTIWQEVYQVVIGKFYSAASLGQYTRAKQFSTISSSNLTMIVQKVSYPALSNLQDNRDRLKAAYRKTIKVTMLISFVVMFGMAGSAKSMILVLIGSQWLECVPYLQIICLSTVLFPLSGLNLDLLKIQGRSDLYLKLEIAKKIIAIGPVLLGIFVSIYWMLLGGLVTGLISAWLNSYYSGPFLNYSLSSQLNDLRSSFGVALFMGLILYGMSFLPISPFVLFPLQILIGAFVAIFTCTLIKLEEFEDIKAIIMPFLLAVKKKL